MPVGAAAAFVCFQVGLAGPGAKGDPGWAGASITSAEDSASTVVVEGEALGPYEPGLLWLRVGPLIVAAINALPARPSLVLVNATGRDHPRRAGLALHIGALLDVPTAGVTHRPLLASGQWPSQEQGARSPLVLGGEVVGYWVRTQPRARPLAAHAAWRTDAATAAEVVLALTKRARTPEPIRLAREAARRARAASSNRRPAAPGG